MKFLTGIYNSQRMNPNNFDNPLTFSLVASTGILLQDLNIYLMYWHRNVLQTCTVIT